ncbi:Pentatricopeptide repeat-containing protein [Platanthera zijinensis]|uniref:Pentatricopeptide repeat-containing protein n=1 Tax=Platanthera zijinensis TaxID=2320716 RepID=A0AAP0BP57_9ASPA
MPMHGVEPNSFTISTAINACSELVQVRIGMELHARIESLGMQSDVVASTALVNMYGKANNVDAARKVFDGMAERNLYTWGTMICVYAQNACCNEALCLFKKFSMMMRPNHFILSSIVNACAGLGSFGPGRSAHAAVIRLGHDRNDVIAGGLIDMYAKCGSIDYSHVVFAQISAPTLIPYTSMIVSAARHGLSRLSFLLFDEMLDRGIRPNSITLLGILHACSHSGLSDAGLDFLKSMHRSYGISPGVKHYTCAIDMLGRAGRLEEALGLAGRIDFSAHDGLMLWSVLASAARMHGRLDVMAEAGARLAELEPIRDDVAGIYVAMSNAYFSAGEWDGAARVRKEMWRRGVRKVPGCSWIEVKDLVHVFYAGNMATCPRKEELVRLLRELEERIIEGIGYRSSLSRNVEFDDEGFGEEGIIVGIHSEILAMAFGILSFPKGSKIRIMKNLRICIPYLPGFGLSS